MEKPPGNGASAIGCTERVAYPRDLFPFNSSAPLWRRFRLFSLTGSHPSFSFFQVSAGSVSVRVQVSFSILLALYTRWCALYPIVSRFSCFSLSIFHHFPKLERGGEKKKRKFPGGTMLSVFTIFECLVHTDTNLPSFFFFFNAHSTTSTRTHTRTEVDRMLKFSGNVSPTLTAVLNVVFDV